MTRPCKNAGALAGNGPISYFDDDTRVTLLELLRDGAGAAASVSDPVHPAWNIGCNPNGGWLLALAPGPRNHARPSIPTR